MIKLLRELAHTLHQGDKWLILLAGLSLILVSFYIPRETEKLTYTINIPEQTVKNSPWWGVTVDKEDLHCLSLNVYFEARNDNLKGQHAVAMVVMNRVLNLNYPDTVCEVIKHTRVHRLHGCQFSWYCDGLKDTPDLSNTLEREAWRRAKMVAENVVKGNFEQPYIPATHYHSTSVDPYWSDSMEFLSLIGQHKFYGEG